MRFLFILLFPLLCQSQIKVEVYNLNGFADKDVSRLFDGDLTTNYNVNNSNNFLAVPYESWVVLDSVYDLTSLKYFTSTGMTQTGFTITFHDKNMIQIGGPISTPVYGRYMSWNTVALNHKGVRFIKFYHNDLGINFEGIMETQFYGQPFEAATPITPIGTNYNPVDKGKYAHGVNILGDRFFKVVSPGDTSVRKVANSVRFYLLYADYEHYPESYYGPIDKQPIFLGRYKYNHPYSTFSLLKRWDMESMFPMAGGPIKSIKDTNIANDNYRWLGLDLPNVKYQEPGADPSSESSFSGVAMKHKQMVALYGSKKYPVSVIEGDSTSGQNLIKEIEWDNEANGWWKGPYYHTPLQYYYGLKSVYNAVKSVDPNIIVWAGALPGWDTVYWKALYFVHYIKSGKSPFPADGFNFNMYLNDGGKQQSGTKGLSPEKFKVRENLIALQQFFNRYYGKPVQWTENGYSIDDVSEYDVDPIGTKTDRQVQADLTLRVKAVTQSVRFISKYYQYAFFEDNTGSFNSMAMFRDSNDWKTSIPYPVAYAVAQEIQIEKNYPWFSTLIKNGGDTGVWVTKKGDMYKIWKGSSNGSTSTYTLPVPCKIYTTNYNGWEPNVSVGKTITVTEGMTWAIEDPLLPQEIYVTNVTSYFNYGDINSTITFSDGTKKVYKEYNASPIVVTKKKTEIIDGKSRIVAYLYFLNGSVLKIYKKE
jgi:hypothetical protein